MKVWILSLLVGLGSVLTCAGASAQVKVKYFAKPKITSAATKRGSVETKTYRLEFTWVDQRGKKHTEKLSVGTETTKTTGSPSSSKYAGRENKTVKWETARAFHEPLGREDKKPFRLLQKCVAFIERDLRYKWRVGPVLIRNGTGRDVRVIPVRWSDERDETVLGDGEALDAPAGRVTRVRAGKKPTLSSRFECQFETPGGRTGNWVFGFDPSAESVLEVTIDARRLAPVVCVGATAAAGRPFRHEWDLPRHCAGVIRVRSDLDGAALSVTAGNGATIDRFRGVGLDADAEYVVVSTSDANGVTVMVNAANARDPVDFRMELHRVPYGKILREHVGGYIVERGLEFVARAMLEEEFDAERTSQRMVEDLLMESALLVVVPTLVDLATNDSDIDWMKLDRAGLGLVVERLPEALGLPGEVATGVLVDIVREIQGNITRPEWLAAEVDLSEPGSG